jgi:hypothetical protein
MLGTTDVGLFINTFPAFLRGNDKNDNIGILLRVTDNPARTTLTTYKY